MNRKMFAQFQHCDFCSKTIESIHMNIVEHSENEKIDYNPKLAENERCEQCADNQRNSFRFRTFICNDCKDIVFIPLIKTGLIDAFLDARSESNKIEKMEDKAELDQIEHDESQPDTSDGFIDGSDVPASGEYS